MLAIVETGGKQYQIEEGKFVDIELIETPENEKVTFDKIVAVIAGEKSVIGQPYVEGASVKGKVLKHFKDKKLIVYKMKSKKGYRKKQGHRQWQTRFLAESIQVPNKEEIAEHSKKMAEETAKIEEAKQKLLTQRYEKHLAKTKKTTPKVTEKTAKTTPKTTSKPKNKVENIQENPEIVNETVEISQTVVETKPDETIKKPKAKTTKIEQGTEEPKAEEIKQEESTSEQPNDSEKA